MKTKRAFYLVFALPLAVAATAFAAEGEMHHGEQMPCMQDGHMQHGKKMSSMCDNHMQHDNMPVQTISTSGTVKKIHAEKNMLTIAHEPVPELEWPAMTMGFKATPEQVQQVKEGDQIKFEFTSEGMNNSIVSISKQ